MPNSSYEVKFKLAGGATVTKVILASHEGDAAVKAAKKFRATAVLRKVK